MKVLLQKLLRSRLIWRLSGLTWPTAVITTKGSYLSEERYLEACRKECELLKQYAKAGFQVLEFGCGLGGNSIAVAPHAGRVVGLDINPFFVGQARKIASRRQATNCEFVSYDGGRLPFDDGRFDMVFSIGVFERIPKPLVDFYVGEFNRVLKSGGISCQSFLNQNARQNEAFLRKLGKEAYVYFGRDELATLHDRKQLKVERVIDWPINDVFVARKP